MKSRRIWLFVMLTGALAAQDSPAADGPFRSQPVSFAGLHEPGFTSLDPEMTRVRFTNLLAAERGLTNQIYYSGSGVAAGDVDGDGLVDLYFCSLDGRNALFRNLGGWKFAQVGDQPALRCAGQASTGAALVDVEGDGDLDLLVSSIGHGVRLFLNDGRGHFTENTAPAGLASDHASMTMAFADVNGDGALDFYVANYRRDTFQDEVNVRFRLRATNGVMQVVAVNDRPATAPDLVNRYYVDASGGIQENGEADVLYLNDGGGRFHAASWTDGTFLDEEGRPLAGPPLDWGLSAMFRDMNGDGAPDLYVCNDGESPDRIWINDGQGRFRALPRRALRETSFASMGIDFADINRDGYDDFFVAEMFGYTHGMRHSQMLTRHPSGRTGDSEDRLPVPRNTLFLNRGDNTYAEIAQLAGLEASDWSWCPAFLDVDLDGFEDLLITTGLGRNLRDADGRAGIESLRRAGRLTQAEFLALRSRLGPLATPNYVFRNRGNLTFENASARWGFDSTQISHGLALADLDNDGDLDVIVACLNAPPLIYRNETTAPRLSVRLKSGGRNSRGVGARIEVRGGPLFQSQEMMGGGRYLSCDDAMRTFACGSATSLTVTVRWPGGATTLLGNALPNHLYEISDPGLEPRRPPRVARPEPLFSDVSRLLTHRHHETEFDDFALQPTLTKRLSTAGPGMAWCDLDGDGRDDLIIGTGRGGRPAAYRNLSNRFERVLIPSLEAMAVDDVLGVSTWLVGRGSNLLLLAQSNYESGQSNALALHRLDGSSGRIVARAEAWDSAAGAVALADLTGQGGLAAFVAGRVQPGKFPRAASSRIYHLRDATLELAASSAFTRLGLVNSAVFTDLDGDGRPELVLACEWGPLKIFRHNRGTFTPWNPPLTGPALHPQLSTLNVLTGWWQGIAAGDFDGDGRMDFVASNWGRNHRYARFIAQPVRVFFGDSNGDGVVEMFEAYHAPEMNRLAPSRHWDTFAFQLPFLRPPGFADFSRLGINEILAPAPAPYPSLAAATFDSTLFLNRGDRFEVRALPIEAQFAPAFGVGVADFDGDGREDVFLAQNLFGTDGETSRSTAGRGLILLGDGAGGFRALPASESGVEMYGEGRGVALGDYDGDGRVDLCVGQNNAGTKLYHNERARPGLRVRLAGPPWNPAGVGAVLRPILADGSSGAAREIHAGSGWLSQDSSVLVFASSTGKISVRWPGGGTSVIEVPARATEIEISREGGVRVRR